MFAFVGAHLGRQFEFVQSEWMNGGDFLGLGDVKDPIAGVARRDRRVSPSRSGRFRGACEVCRGSSSRAAASTASCPGCAPCAGSRSFGHDARRRWTSLVIGGGPAGLLAALRAGDLGARTALVTRDAFGGMAAHDGPVPVRTLAHAARLMRDARQLGRYGIAVAEPVLDYPRLLARVREVVDDVRAHAALRAQIDAAGVTVHEHAGVARFVGPAHGRDRRAGCGFAPRRSSSARAASAGASRSPDSS